MLSRIPFDRVNWTTSSFLIGTLALTLTVVPLYLWHFGLDWFQFALFAVLLAMTGISITLGYHRLFSHLTFRARLPVRFFVLLFGAGAFENSALMWASEHRRHHKHVDHEEDPYDISKGFFHAHIGWLLFKLLPQPPFDNVADLKKDRLVMWQHRYVHLLAVLVSLVLPALLGGIWNGWSGALGGFLLGGVTKIVVLQHCTFLINSACHTIGHQPYSTRCSARDSTLMALLTFGEGYHNYHHEFQHDYRNGVKRWQFDPTKWTIWTLSKLGLTGSLRRVPDETIKAAQQRQSQSDARRDVATVAGWARALEESLEASMPIRCSAEIMNIERPSMLGRSVQLFIAMALVLAAAGCTAIPKSLNPLAIPLQYKMMASAGEFPSVPSCAAISTIQVNDARTTRVIGKRYVETNPSVSAPVNASSDMRAWVRSGAEASAQRVRISQKPGAAVLRITIRQIAANENVARRSGYEGRVLITAELVRKGGGTCWQDRFEGTAENYGYSGTTDNYQETLNHALDRAMIRLFSDPGFQRSICACGG